MQQNIPDWILKNNKIVDENGNVTDLSQDKEAAKSYFLNHVNKKPQIFHSLREKLDFLVENDYYESEFLTKYTYEQIKEIFNKRSRATPFVK